VWIHDEATVVADDDGNPMALQGVMSDITSRKQTEDELKATQNYLIDVFDSLQSMLVSVNTEGDVTQWNKVAEEFTGITAETALTKKIWEVGPLLQKYQSNIIQVLQTQAPVELARETYPGDDKKFLNISIYPLTNHGRGAVIRIDDVTELEKKDAQLLQAQKLEMVGTLAGGLAHDFNNVLSGIIGSTSLIRFMLENNQPDLERIKTNIDTIGTSANRAADMVQQLMTISKKHELSIAPVDLNQAVRHVIRICKSTFDKSIEINAIYFPRAAMVSADVAQIEQALLNLAVNASHAMTIMRQDFETHGGILTIAVEKIHIDRHFCESHPGIEEGDHWIIRVIDTGVGMDVKTIKKIFDPFFTTKEKSQGTGLGLAMVYNIIHQHRGYLDVYSNPGIGTTFNILLPVLPESEAVIKKQVIKEAMPRGSGTILVVDDEEIIRETAKGILEMCGYSVLIANDGQSGIDTFRENSGKIKAILLDMAMPKISGKETYIELKKIQPDLKVVLASGFRQDKRVQEALDLGVNEFIQKPYSMLELAKKIKLVIEGKN
jgi:PAS domain S-box-containing protein